jgi:hypothetical protein
MAGKLGIQVMFSRPAKVLRVSPRPALSLSLPQPSNQTNKLSAGPVPIFLGARFPTLFFGQLATSSILKRPALPNEA